MPDRLAIVVPRCSETAYGGAEALALQVAVDLKERYEVDILTTCADDYWSWQNVHEPGVSQIEGVTVRRFLTDAARDLPRFNRLSRSFRFRIASLSVKEQEEWIRMQGPYSSTLLQFLFAERDSYTAFIFMPYLYATTYFGLPLVRDRAVLIPLVHDEWPLYFSAWSSIFDSAQEIFFVTPEEGALVRHRFPRVHARDVLYPGLASQPMPDEEPAPAHIPRPFMLYLGRMDESKGINDLRDLFSAYLKSHPDSLWHLVVAGPGPTPPEGEHVISVGAVNTRTKWQLLKNCDLFVAPGLFESLSIATIEAWRAGRAAIVNGRNETLVGQARRSNGALWYYDESSFGAVLDQLDEQTRRQLGAQGKKYVRRTYSTGNTVEVLERAIAQFR